MYWLHILLLLCCCCFNLTLISSTQPVTAYCVVVVRRSALSYLHPYVCTSVCMYLSCIAATAACSMKYHYLHQLLIAIWRVKYPTPYKTQHRDHIITSYHRCVAQFIFSPANFKLSSSVVDDNAAYKHTHIYAYACVYARIIRSSDFCLLKCCNLLKWIQKLYMCVRI